MPGLYWFLRLLAIVWAAITVFHLFIKPAIFYQLLEVIGLVALLASIFAGFRSVLLGYYPARYFLAAYSVFFLTMTVYLLTMIDLIAPPDFELFLLLPGLALAAEGILLAFSLASRYHLLKKESLLLREMRNDLQLAVEVQKYLLPPAMPCTDQICMAAAYLPSRTISGDFYDIYEDAEKKVLSVFIADIAGHGYSAGLVAAMLKVAYLETVEKQEKICLQLVEINRILHSKIDNTFLTAAILYFDLDKKQVSFARSGHPPLLHYSRSNGKVTEYQPSGQPLAMDKKYKCEKINLPLDSGDRFFLYTDGLTEEVNARGEAFGIQRLHTLLTANAGRNAHDFCQILKNEIKNWQKNEHPSDDITFIIMDIV